MYSRRTHGFKIGELLQFGPALQMNEVHAGSPVSCLSLCFYLAALLVIPVRVFDSGTQDPGYSQKVSSLNLHNCRLQPPKA